MSDSGDSEDGSTLLERAMDWDGSEDELIELGWDLSYAFDHIADDEDQFQVRDICHELLSREELPDLQRAQFLVYIAATEEEGDCITVRARSDEAVAVIASAKSLGMKDERMYRLSETVEKLIQQVDDAAVPREEVQEQPALPKLRVTPESSKGQLRGIQYPSKDECVALANYEDQELPGKLASLQLPTALSAPVTESPDQDIVADHEGLGKPQPEPKSFSRIVSCDQDTKLRSLAQRRPSQGSMRRGNTPRSIRLKQGNQAFLGSKDVTPTQPIIKKAKSRSGLASLFSRGE